MEFPSGSAFPVCPLPPLHEPPRPMIEDTRPPPRYAIDRLVTRGRRLFGWGWVADPARRVERVALSVRGENWRVELPANHGLARADVRLAFPELVDAEASGFVVTGYLPQAPASGIALVLAFADGSQASIDVTKTLETHSERRRKLRELAWVGRAVLRRARQRDFRGILHRAKAQNFGAPSLDSVAVVERLLPRLAGDRSITVVFDHNMGGGANVYRRDLIAERLAAGRTVLLCTYNLPTLDYRLHVFMPGSAEELYRISSFVALEPILARARVDELFLNSPVSFDEPLVFAGWLGAMRARHATARLVVAAHDYIAVCPSFVLLDADGRYCGIPDVGECARCLARHRASYVTLSPPSEIGPWRALWGGCLAAADEVRCFSESTRGLLRRAYPTLADARVTVVPHRLDYAPARQPRLDHAAPAAIGVIGNISAQKGARIVRDVVLELDRRKSDVRVVVLGTLDGAPASARLTVTGRYQRDELPDLIEAHRLNLFLFPSVCPETFSYVIEEMMLLALPIVAFDLGAPAERLRHYAAARLAREVSAKAALAALDELREQLAAAPTSVA